VRRDEHPVVGDVQQSVRGLDLNPSSREVSTDVVAVLEDADAARSVHPTTDRPSRTRSVFLPLVGIDDLFLRRGDELEATDRRDVSDRLVLAISVVAPYPAVELELRLLDGGEDQPVEELLSPSPEG